MEDPYFDVKVNVLGSVLLLDNCRRRASGRWSYASSGGAMYGEADRNLSVKTRSRGLFPLRSQQDDR